MVVCSASPNLDGICGVCLFNLRTFSIQISVRVMDIFIKLFKVIFLLKLKFKYLKCNKFINSYIYIYNIFQSTYFLILRRVINVLI